MRRVVVLRVPVALRDVVAVRGREERVRVERELSDLRAVDLRGLPPSRPLSRDERALRFDRTEPRQAGQNETRSIL
jgi:hypothetical protein